MSTRFQVLRTSLFALSLAGAAPALAGEFEIMPGSIQLVEFESEAPIENIRGLSTEAKGAITLDPAKPSSATGLVTLPVASLRTGNTTRDGHLQLPEWLDAKGYPDIVFSLGATTLDLKGPLALGATTTGRIHGTFTIKGTTRKVELPIKVAYIAASDKLKKVMINGNALRVKGELTLKLADYGVNPPAHLAGLKVAEEVTVRFALTAVEK